MIHDPGLRACRRVGAMTTLQQAAAEVVADMDALVRDRELVTLPQSVRDLRSALAAEDARDEGIGGLVVAVARAAATFADFEVAMRLTGHPLVAEAARIAGGAQRDALDAARAAGLVTS